MMKKSLITTLVGLSFTVWIAGCADPPALQVDTLRAQLDAVAADAQTYAPDAFKAAGAAVDAYQAELTAQQSRFAMMRSYEDAEKLGTAADTAVKQVQPAIDAEKQRLRSETERMLADAKNALDAAQTGLGELPKKQAAELEPAVTSATESVDAVNATLAGGDLMAAHRDASAALDAAKNAGAPVATAVEEMEAARQAAAERRAKGLIDLPRAVMADGTRLAAGSYEVRVTDQQAPPVAGQGAERWVEFVRGGKVAGRALAIVMAKAEMNDVAKSAEPGTGEARVEVLKSNDYVRVWLNRGGTYFLVHLPVA
jgi:hypothetical protein